MENGGNNATTTQPTEASFLQFLSGLAVQTLMHLGQVAYPGSDQRKVDLPNARYSIDLLAILGEKTKGNLTPEESRYLEHILKDLRLEYVQTAGSLSKKTPDEKS